MKSQQPYAIQPLTAVPAPKESVEPTPKDRGIVATFIRWVLELVWTRRYRRHLSGLAEQRHASIVYGNLNRGDFVQSFESLTAGFLPHFPHERHSDISRLGQIVEANIKEVAEVTVEESRDDIANRNKKTQRLQSDLTDKEQRLVRLEGGSVEPPAENVQALEEFHTKQGTLDSKYAMFGRLRAKAVLAAGQATGASVLETINVYLYLTPIFSGVAGFGLGMILALSVTITSVLVFLGHNLWSDNTDKKTLSAITLIVMVAALTLVRSAGLSSYGTDGIAAGEEHQITTYAVIVLLALAGLILAIIGGGAFRSLKNLSNEAAQLRADERETITKLESEIAATRTHRARQQATRLNDKKHILVLERDIRKTQAELQRHIATTRRLIARRVKRNARRRLSGDISNMARQLAHWRCNPSPPTTTRVNLASITTNGILFCVGLLGTACTSSNVSTYNVLLDNSGSTAELNQEAQGHILDALRDWSKTASPADNFILWSFSETGSGSHPAHRRTLTMPSLSVPAYAARQRFASEAVITLEAWFDEIPQGTKHTPLLETIFFIGLAQNEPWRLVIYSDLQQDSPTWNKQHHNSYDEEALLDRMLELCPTVTIPPVSVSLKAWPGIAARGRDPIKEHQHDRYIFQQFFDRWSPEASVDITSL